MLSNQPTRDIINQAGFEYAELWEVQGALKSKTPQIILDLQQTKEGIKVRGNKAIKKEGLQEYMNQVMQETE